jgi:hypothetical protein
MSRRSSPASRTASPSRASRGAAAAPGTPFVSCAAAAPRAAGARPAAPDPALLDHLEARLQRALDDPFAALLAEAELRALLRLVAHARAAVQDAEVEALEPAPHAA